MVRVALGRKVKRRPRACSAVMAVRGCRVGGMEGGVAVGGVGASMAKWVVVGGRAAVVMEAVVETVVLVKTVGAAAVARQSAVAAAERAVGMVVGRRWPASQMTLSV